LLEHDKIDEQSGGFKSDYHCFYKKLTFEYNNKKAEFLLGSSS